MHHHYRACTLEPVSCDSWNLSASGQCAETREATAMSSLCTATKSSPCSPQLKLSCSSEDPAQPKIRILKNKIFIQFVTILLLSYIFLGFWPWGMWYLSSLTKGRNCAAALGCEVPNTGLPGKPLIGAVFKKSKGWRILCIWSEEVTCSYKHVIRMGLLGR